MALGRYEEALALRRTLASSAGTPEYVDELLECMARAGEAYLAAGDPERAASLLSELEELDAPSALTAELLRGVEAARQRALDGAWSAIEMRAWAEAEERMDVRKLGRAWPGPGSPPTVGGGSGGFSGLDV